MNFIVAIADKKKTLKGVEKWIEANSETTEGTNFINDLESELEEMEDYMKSS